MMETEDRIIHEYDIMRVFATVLVVIGHSVYLSMETPYGGVDYTGLLSLGNVARTAVWQGVSSVVRFIYSFHMPLFFLISGAVFMYEWNRGKYDGLEAFLIKKVKRLIVPAVTYGMLWVIPIKLIARFYNINTAIAAISRIYSSEPGHLWFLYTLFYIFVIAFFLLRFSPLGEKKRILLLAVLLLIPLQHVLEVDILGQSDIFYYLVFFLLGCCFENYRKFFEAGRTAFKRGGAAACALLSVLLFQGVKAAELSGRMLCDILNTSYIAAVALGLYLISSLLKKYLIANSAYRLLLKEIFNIYLLHDPLNYLILFVVNKFLCARLECEITALLLVFSRTIGILLLCLIISRLIAGCPFCLDYRILPVIFGICLYITAINTQRGVELGWTYEEAGVDAKARFTASKLTENVWSNGVSYEQFAVLAPYDGELYDALEKSEALYTGNVRSTILNVENVDGVWIMITLDRDCDITAFSYPNAIMAY